MIDLKSGDRIELVSMPLDPCPIEPGTKGTIVDIMQSHCHWQVWVRWDNGRSLAMCCPPDEYKKL